MLALPVALDLSFTPGAHHPWARVMVIRPSRDYDDAVTLNFAAGELGDFEEYLNRLQHDIEIIRAKAREAFERPFQQAA